MDRSVFNERTRPAPMSTVAGQALRALTMLVVVGVASCTTGGADSTDEPLPTGAPTATAPAPVTTAPPSATVAARLDDRFEYLTFTLAGEDWIVIRFIDPGDEDLMVLAAEFDGRVRRDERTGCYGTDYGPGTEPGPVMWPPGASLGEDGSLIVPGVPPIPLGGDFKAVGGEAPLPPAVAELCAAERGWEVGVILPEG